MTERRNESAIDLSRRQTILALLGSALAIASRRGRAASSQPLDLIGAPSNLGLRPPAPGRQPGTWRAPQVLREWGLAQRLAATDRGDVPRPPYDPRPDAATGFRNGAELPRFTRALAAKIGESLDRGAFPLVLGGDCSVVLGGVLALRRRGRHGLLFVDGHPDFYEATEPGPRTAAGVDLALATGHGPRELVDLDGLQPYVQGRDVAVLAHRDYRDEPGYSFETFRRSGASQWPIERVREHGVANCTREALALLEKPDLDGFWLHLDVDVLDPQVMPAVDSLDPGGLRVEELRELLGLALASSRCRGMHVGIYDPDLDPGRRYGRAIVDLLVSAFSKRFAR